MSKRADAAVPISKCSTHYRPAGFELRGLLAMPAVDHKRTLRYVGAGSRRELGFILEAAYGGAVLCMEGSSDIARIHLASCGRPLVRSSSSQ